MEELLEIGNKFFIAEYVKETDCVEQYFTLGKKYIFVVAEADESHYEDFIMDSFDKGDFVTIDDTGYVHSWTPYIFINHFKLIKYCQED